MISPLRSAVAMNDAGPRTPRSGWVPAHQGFERDDAVVVEGDDGLVVDVELVVIDPSADVGLVGGDLLRVRGPPGRRQRNPVDAHHADRFAAVAAHEGDRGAHRNGGAIAGDLAALAVPTAGGLEAPPRGPGCFEALPGGWELRVIVRPADDVEDVRAEDFVLRPPIEALSRVVPTTDVEVEIGDDDGVGQLAEHTRDEMTKTGGRIRDPRRDDPAGRLAVPIGG